MQTVVKKCANCNLYNPITGEPPAGYCEFMERRNIPFWAEKFSVAINRLGHDVLAQDGENCDAFEPSN